MKEGERMTDEQVNEINKIVKECRHRHQDGVCRMQVLPCTRAIDKGICPEIIEYLQNQKVERKSEHSGT